MALRGQIYGPKKNLPPGSPQWHRVVVLSPNIMMSARGACAVVAVILSRAKRRLIPGHSIPIAAGAVPALPVDSVVETHHLFGLSTAELGSLEGTLPQDIMADVLAGARLLFS